MDLKLSLLKAGYIPTPHVPRASATVAQLAEMLEVVTNHAETAIGIIAELAGDDDEEEERHLIAKSRALLAQVAAA